MKLAIAAIAIIIGAALASLALFSPEGGGAAWDDDSDNGHSMLIDRLARETRVRAVESSLALLPESAGEGDTLFLFPTHRPAAEAEVDRVRRFVADGGHVVIAADGQNAAVWSESLSVKYQGLPAILPPGHDTGCVPVTVSVEAAVYKVCLPSPTTFPNLTRLDDHAGFTQIALSDVPVFLDTDLDGNLSLGDQGPVSSPVALEWRLGRGRVVAIADADLWRNGFLRSHEGSGNLALAGALASGDTVYVDSSGRQDTLTSRTLNPGYRLLSAPGAWEAAALVALVAIAALGTAMAPRAKPLLRHDPPEDAVDAEIERAAMAYLEARNNPAP